MPSATKSCSGSDEHAGGQRHEAPTQATSRTSITSTEPGSAQVTETRRQRPLAGERREAMVTCTLNDADRHDMSATPPYSVQQHATHCLPACPPARLPACLRYATRCTSICTLFLPVGTDSIALLPRPRGHDSQQDMWLSGPNHTGHAAENRRGSDSCCGPCEFPVF